MQNREKIRSRMSSGVVSPVTSPTALKAALVSPKISHQANCSKGTIKMDLGLKGKNAIILGGTRGIGRAHTCCAGNGGPERLLNEPAGSLLSHSALKGFSPVACRSESQSRPDLPVVARSD